MRLTYLNNKSIFLPYFLKIHQIMSGKIIDCESYKSKAEDDSLYKDIALRYGKT